MDSIHRFIHIRSIDSLYGNPPRCFTLVRLVGVVVQSVDTADGDTDVVIDDGTATISTRFAHEFDITCPAVGTYVSVVGERMATSSPDNTPTQTYIRGNGWVYENDAMTEPLHFVEQVDHERVYFSIAREPPSGPDAECPAGSPTATQTETTQTASAFSQAYLQKPSDTAMDLLAHLREHSAGVHRSELPPEFVGPLGTAAVEELIITGNAYENETGALCPL